MLATHLGIRSSKWREEDFRRANGLHLFITGEVTNVGHDREQLSSMADKAREAVRKRNLTVLADRGYLNTCVRADGGRALVPKPLTSGNRALGLFDKGDFRYIPAKDEYRYPAGERAIWRFTTVEKGMTIHKYWSSACPSCPMKA